MRSTGAKIRYKIDACGQRVRQVISPNGHVMKSAVVLNLARKTKSSRRLNNKRKRLGLR